MALRCKQTKQAKAAGASAAAKKRPAKACRRKALTLGKFRAIIAKLKTMCELPESVRGRLKQFSRGKLKGKPDTEALAQVLQEALSSVEKTLLGELRAAYTAVDGAGSEKEAREAAQVAAEASVAELAKTVSDRKASLKSDAKTIEEKTRGIAEAKASLKASHAELNIAHNRKRKFETVEKDVYTPLRDVMATGAEGQGRVKSLCKAGKVNGFHGELLTVLPAILRKQLDKRQTFDVLALKQLDSEFCKRTNALGDEVRCVEQKLAEKSSDLEEAQAALQSAKEQERQDSRELAGAEKALIAGKEEVLQARRHVRGFPTAIRQAARALDKAKARVSKFRSGPLSKFREAVPNDTVPTEDDAADSAVGESACVPE